MGRSILFLMFEIVDTLLDLADLLGHGYLLRADLCTLPQRLAAPRSMFVVEERNPLIGCFIPRIEEVSERPDECSRSHISLRLRVLIDRTRGGAAGTENTPDGRFKHLLLFWRTRELDSFLFGRAGFRDEIGFNRTILFKEEIEIHNQVFDHFENWKRLNQDFLLESFHQLLTGEATDAVNSHPVRSADAMATGPAKG